MYFIGDTHGIREVFNIIDRLKLEGQNLIHVGDFGLGFQEITRDVKNLLILDEALLETNNKLYVIRGNHDNPIFWDRSKGLWLPKFHNIHLMEDFSIRHIEGKNILFVGGALSIDRSPRKVEHPPSWWKDERFFYDRLKLDKAINQKANAVDIVVTHSAPNFCHPTNNDVQIVNYYHKLEEALGNDLKQELKDERDEVTEFYHDLTLQYKQRPTHWFYGHFHSSKRRVIDGTAFKLLDVNEVYELNEFGEGIV